MNDQPRVLSNSKQSGSLRTLQNLAGAYCDTNPFVTLILLDFLENSFDSVNTMARHIELPGRIALNLAD